jgi:3-hydroxyacyl-CoA dehydrogenase
MAKLLLLIGLSKLLRDLISKISFEQVEKYRKPGTLITSNTSGIPIHFMSEGRSEDFQKHFVELIF